MGSMLKDFAEKLRKWWVAEGEDHLDIELWPLHRIPEQYSRRTEPRGSVYQAPLEVDITGIGQIKQVEPLAKALRKIMQAEMKARGPIPKSEPGKPRLFSEILRGTYYHGRETLPEGEELLKQPFKEARARSGNLGEPIGISLTYKPEVSAKFSKIPDPGAMEDLQFQRTQRFGPGLYRYDVFGGKLEETWAVMAKSVEEAKEKLAKYHDFTRTKVARTMPLFGGPPEKSILKAWEPKAGAEFKEAYSKATRRMIKETPEIRRSATDYDSFKGVLEGGFNREGQRLNERFNELVTEALKEKGYKGVLYSPHRYGEYELRMFNPEDVLMLEQRSLREKGIERAWRLEYGAPEGSAREKGTRLASLTRGKPASLRDWYQEIDIESLLKE